MEIDHGVIDLLLSKNSECSEEYTFYLSGDLSQMLSQKNFLVRKGFDVFQNNVYPVVKEKDITRALKEIWGSKVEGWWHYDKQYIDLGICTEEEFGTALHR